MCECAGCELHFFFFFLNLAYLIFIVNLIFKNLEFLKSISTQTMHSGWNLEVLKILVKIMYCITKLAVFLISYF